MVTIRKIRCLEKAPPPLKGSSRNCGSWHAMKLSFERNGKRVWGVEWKPSTVWVTLGPRRENVRNTTLPL